jgi:uncharacterized iron-regulated membrane protein
MGWRRRPLQALLGLPANTSARLPRRIVAAITMIAILFPLMGVSLAFGLLASRSRRLQRSYPS